MKSLWQKFLADEAGVVLSSEIVLVGTMSVLGVAVGLEAVTSAVNSELNDFACAIGGLNQSFSYRSIAKPGHASVGGAGFNDLGDFGDCAPITRNEVFGQSVTESVVIESAGVGAVAPVVREPTIQRPDRL